MLLRHADSGDKLQGQTDKDRGLTRKGTSQCSAVATFMKSKSLIPDTVIASDAMRVRGTLDVILKEISPSTDPDYVNELYEAEVETFLKVIRSVGEAQSLLVAGHNPAITSFAAFISKTKINGIGTANLLVFQFNGSSWTEVDKGVCEMMEHFAPEP